MITYILERLAICSAIDARRAPRDISAFLNVAEEVEFSREGSVHLKVPLKDLVPIAPEAMSEAVKWIREQITHHGVMVFCNAGIGRSPSIVVAYLCGIGFGYDDAVRFLSSRRPEFTLVPNLSSSIEDCINFYL